jgi:general nucleoside transport system ATP-binding protein
MIQDNPSSHAIGVETVGISKRFASFTALDNVSMRFDPGSFHAVLGENGAGKSTLVKCMMGFHPPTSGQLMVNGREVEISHPRDAHRLGMGMVYQHFTLVPSLTAAENLVISADDTSAVINWSREREKLDAFMQSMPFQVELQRQVNRLSAGEKQKLELLKQLYLGRRFLVLDEPTSVLAPSEADHLLGTIREMTVAGMLTVLMITHKFREVEAFASHVSVLRRGAYVGGGKVADLDRAEMTRLMIGERDIVPIAKRTGAKGAPVLQLANIKAVDRSGFQSIRIDSLSVHAGEITGIAGISGNGQFELVELLTGQRQKESGEMWVQGEALMGDRDQEYRLNIKIIPEEPLKNACAPDMSVQDNLAFRNFDRDKSGRGRFTLNGGAIAANAADLIKAFKIKTSSPDIPISSLSGGNIQRAVLARELSGDVDLLIVANPCFGLDISAVAQIRSRLIAARNKGTAILLLSEDLDEILELSDRICVMSEGALVYETAAIEADIATIGAHMAGHA